MIGDWLTTFKPEWAIVGSLKLWNQLQIAAFWEFIGQSV